MSEKLFRGELDTLVLFHCDDFPILCVIESFLDSYKAECRKHGWKLPTDVFIENSLYLAVLRELAATQGVKLKTLEDYKDITRHARFDNVGIQPTLISGRAIRANPSIQYFFVINDTTKELHGV